MRIAVLTTCTSSVDAMSRFLDQGLDLVLGRHVLLDADRRVHVDVHALHGEGDVVQHLPGWTITLSPPARWHVSGTGRTAPRMPGSALRADSDPASESLVGAQQRGDLLWRESGVGATFSAHDEQYPALFTAERRERLDERHLPHGAGLGTPMASLVSLRSAESRGTGVNMSSSPKPPNPLPRLFGVDVDGATGPVEPVWEAVRGRVHHRGAHGEAAEAAPPLTPRQPTQRGYSTPPAAASRM